MKNPSIFVVIAIAVLAGLFVWLKPKAPEAPSAPLEVPAPAVPAPRAFDWVVKEGKLVAGPAVMQVVQGEDVAIKLTSDQADELHLHGYELHAEVNANEPATLYFKATHTGRFGLELHQAHLELGTLEVSPQ
jgi:hypothetical protein